MFQRLLITSSLLLGSSFTFIPSALAQSVDIIFSGVVQDYASFTTPSLEQIEDFASAGNKSVSQSSSGINAGLSIQSSTSTSIKLSSPHSVSSSQTKSLETRDIAAFKSGSTGDRNEYISSSAGKSHLEMDILIEKSDKFKPMLETYFLTVTITAE